MLKTAILTIFLTLPLVLVGQISDAFDDGDFTTDPMWIPSNQSGDGADFQVNANVLQSKGPPATATLSIATAYAVDLSVNTVVWTFTAEYTASGDGSDTNYIEIFLSSDRSDLLDSPVGYYIRMGENGSTDGIDLFKTSSSTPVIEDLNNLVGDDLAKVGIRVSRTAAGLWILEADVAGGSNYVEIGSGTDTEFTLSSYFGFRVGHSSTRSDDYLFDDVLVTVTPFVDMDPPTISAVNANAATEVQITFNEDVDEATAENVANYVLDQGISVASAVRDVDDQAVVRLLVDPLTNGQTYTVTVNNVEDQAGNPIASDATADFEYISLVVPGSRDIVINEFIADPSPVIGLPDAEFVELYNATEQFFDLSGFFIEEVTSVGATSTSNAFGTFILRPDSLVIICDMDQVNLFDDFGQVIGVDNFPDFNQSNSSVRLLTGADELVDELVYGSEPTGNGRSFEMINPFLPCKGTFNFAASTDPAGGTPGEPNSVFDDSEDQQAPEVMEVVVVGADSLVITFSEAIDPSTVTMTAASIEGYSNNQVLLSAFDQLSVKLDGSLVSEETYDIAFADLADCSGNEVSGTLSFYHDIKPPVVEQIIVATDRSIFAVFDEPIDESSAEDEDHFGLDQSIGVPTKAILQDTTNNRVLLTFDADFTIGTTYLLTYNGVEDTLENPAMASASFEFQSEIDTVQAITGNLIQVTFDERPSVATAANTHHYLLPGMGHPSEVSVLKGDSSAVRLAFANTVDDNKDLLLYVEGLMTAADGRKMITPAATFRYDTDAPGLVTLEAVSARQLRLVFDENIDPSSAENLSFFRLEDDTFPIGGEAEGATVLLTFAEDFEIEQKKTLTYTRIGDLYGNFSTTNRREDFVYDPRAPLIDTAFQLGTRELIIQAHEALSFQKLQTGDFQVNGVSPSVISIFGPDSLRLLLGFSEPILKRLETEIVVANWSDRQGNKLSAPLQKTINTLDPQLVVIEPTSDTTVALRYSQEMSSQSFDRASYQINGAVPNELTSDSDTTLVLSMGTEWIDGEEYALEMTDIVDANGRLLQEDQVSFRYDTYLSGLHVTDSITLTLEFETEIASVASSNFQVDGMTPTLAWVDEAGTSVQLVLAGHLPENKPLICGWSNLVDRFGRRLPDHRERFEWDTAPPQLQAVESGFDGALTLHFSEPIDQEASIAPSQFEILTLGVTEDLIFETDTSVSLRFSTLTAGADYQLVVSNFQDLGGNQTSSDTISFAYLPPAIAPPGSIIITEIMADPSPSRGLPEVEYIELFNASNTAYNLSALSLSKSNDAVSLPDLELHAGAYVAWVDPGSVHLFEEGIVTGLEGLLSFSNNGDSIVLVNRLGEVVDRVVYTQEWYRDTDKDDGGFSLELINPNSECDGPANWIASSADAGGTPAEQNATFSTQPETVPPLVVSSTLLTASSLEISFNEEMDPSTLIPTNFELPALTVLEVVTTSPYQTAVLSFDQEIIPGQVLSLEVSNLADCGGNVMDTQTLMFGLGREPQFLDLVITEIFADPDPMVGLPDAEFLEIKNVSRDLISLSSTRIRDESDSSQPIGGILLPGETLLLAPSGELTEFVDMPARGVEGWRSLSNGGERLALVKEQQLLFQVAYTDDWHDPNKRDGGYSLEMRDAGNPCGLVTNWGSSVDPSGGTPGRVNSIASSVPDNFGPRLLSATAITDDSIRLDFDETLFPFGGGVVSISDGIEVEDISILESAPNQLFLSVAPALESSFEYQITTESVRDCLGNSRSDNEASLVLPVQALPGEVLLSEVLFDPRPDGFDFVEVYNPTDLFLSLQYWQVANDRDADVVTMEELILKPGGYLAFTENKARLLLDYPLGAADAIFEVGALPTLPNDEGAVVLKDQLGRVQDSLFYTHDFHNRLLADQEGVSLERISFSASNVGNNWISASSVVGFATPGYANSQARGQTMPPGQVKAEPKVFIPGSGVASFTTINYAFGSSGQFANISLYDQNGRLVRQLAEGLALSSTGFVTWDGTNDQGAAVRMGYYLIVFEVFAANGASEVIKETVVVGRDF